MDISPEEQLHNDLWRVLQMIRKRELYWPLSDGKVIFVFSNPGSDFETADNETAIEYLMLNKLEKLGAIIIKPHEDKFILKILNPRFTELYEKYRAPYQVESDSSEKLEEPQVKSKIIKNSPLILYLDKSDNLYEDPKRKYCYKLMGSRNRLKYIRILAIHQTKTSDYLSTNEFALTLGKSAQYIRGEKPKINMAAKRSLKLDRYKLELLDGKQGSGYRINPEIRIKILPR